MYLMLFALRRTVSIIEGDMIDTIIQGDCLEIMKGIDDKSIDMILCDLPYGMTACDWDVRIPFEPLWEAYKRIIKDNGTIVLTASQPFTSMLVMSNLEMFKEEMIWDKRLISGIFNAKQKHLKQHENIILFSKDKYTYNPQFRNNPLLRYGKQNKHTSESYGNTEFTDNQGVGYPRSILSMARPYNLGEGKVYHPTQKPVALFEYLIRTYTNEGDLVLDNCAGSGTTGVACINLNRHYILIEKKAEYVEIARKRVAEARLVKDSQPLFF